jgi:hypothetical protein
VRIIVEVRINKVRKLARPPMDLDQVRSFDFAQVGSATALVNSQERFERLQGAAVHDARTCGVDAGPSHTTGRGVCRTDNPTITITWNRRGSTVFKLTRYIRGHGVDRSCQ